MTRAKSKGEPTTPPFPICDRCEVKEAEYNVAVTGWVAGDKYWLKACGGCLGQWQKQGRVLEWVKLPKLST